MLDHRWLLLVAFLLRLGFSVGLYLAASRANHVHSLHLLNQWLSAPDANLYHSMALNVWRYFNGILAAVPLNLPANHANYPVLLGGIYYLLSPSPLWGIFFNSAAFLGLGFLVHRLAIQVGHPSSRALFISVLAVCWPLGLASSLTLLRESFILLTVLGILVFLTNILNVARQGRWGWSWSGLGLLLSLYLLVTLRPEMKWPTLAVTITGICWSVSQNLIRKWRVMIWRPLAACLIMLAAIWLAGQYPPQAMVKLEGSPFASSGQPAQVAGQTASGIEVAAGLRPEKSSSVSLDSDLALPLILDKRRAYASDGGLSLSMHAFWVVDGVGGYIFAAAVGWRDLLLYPYPWEGPPSGGMAQRAALTVFTLLWYACLPGVAWGILHFARSPSPAAGLIAAWVLLVGTALALIVVNLGTLFRMRDMVLMPALLLISPQPYVLLYRLIGRTKSHA